MRRTLLVATSAGMMGGLCPSTARAEFLSSSGSTFVTPGLLTGLTPRDSHVVGSLGAEVGFHHFDPSGLGAGGFVQWQWMALESHRFCAGLQATSATVRFVGVEGGLEYETADARRAGTFSLHVAPFLSVGVATLGLRLGIPLYSVGSALPGRGFEGGLTLALKAPIDLRQR
jgi:hypothetical protein